jgi:hypothetical protein
MNLKKLYQIAKKELEKLYDGEPMDFRLEQVEHIDNFGVWEVVVSYLVENKNRPEINPISPFGNVGTLKYERVYKSLKINDKNEVTAFHMFDKTS